LAQLDWEGEKKKEKRGMGDFHGVNECLKGKKRRSKRRGEKGNPVGRETCTLNHVLLKKRGGPGEESPMDPQFRISQAATNTNPRRKTMGGG